MTKDRAIALCNQIAATYAEIQAEVVEVGRGRNKVSGLRLVFLAQTTQQRSLTVASSEQWESVRVMWALLLEG